MDDILGIAMNLEMLIGYDGFTVLRNLGPRDYHPMLNPWEFLRVAESHGWISDGTAFAIRDSMLKWDL